MQAEIDRQMALLRARKEELLSVLNAKKDELELEKFKMETQLYMLDSEIYSIRCLMGETVNSVKLRSGAPASPEIPLVVFRKVRYLDEELARLTAIYDVDGEFEFIERFFKHSPYTFEFFTPAPRCVTLVRISRTEKFVANSDLPGMENCLKAYDLEHGTCIGIMVRDGDNIWMGWTEEDRVNIQQDLFFTSHSVVEPPIEMVLRDSEKSELSRRKETMRQAVPMVSRAFVFNILQGFLCGENGVIHFPEPINIAKQISHHDSPYIVFSAADGWLEDNRYGSMREIIQKCNSRLTQGDHILTTQHVLPENYDPWSHRYLKNNDRGRGYNDRTHDCRVRDNTIYLLNLIETVSRTLYVYFTETDSKGNPKNPYTAPDGRMYASRVEAGDPDKVTEEDVEKIIQNWSFDQRKFLCTAISEDIAQYVSVEKSCSLSGNARSNMRVYEDEFINLTYFNSVWGEYLLTTRKTGDFRQFADAARYINTALQFVRKREEKEFRLIREEFPELKLVRDWPVLLSEWKLEKGVRNITPYQAKRFARFLRENLPAILQ